MCGVGRQLSGLSAVSDSRKTLHIFIFHDVLEVKSASQSKKSKQEKQQYLCVFGRVCNSEL